MSNKRRTKVILTIFVSILLFSATYAFANAIPVTVHDEKPRILGTITLNVEITDVKDLYAWQILLIYDPQKLMVLKVEPGGFLGSVSIDELNVIKDDIDDIFVYANFPESGMLLIGGSLIGNVEGKDGGGLLARVTFGYLSVDYVEPRLVFDRKPYETKLLDSNGCLIPVTVENFKIYEKH